MTSQNNSLPQNNIADPAEEVASYVRRGLRTKGDLKRCGCPTCKETLRILRGRP